MEIREPSSIPNVHNFADLLEEYVNLLSEFIPLNEYIENKSKIDDNAKMIKVRQKLEQLANEFMIFMGINGMPGPLCLGYNFMFTGEEIELIFNNQMSDYRKRYAFIIGDTKLYETKQKAFIRNLIDDLKKQIAKLRIKKADPRDEYR